jgi:glyoxylase-like metal-dependent hydrolase (beta-lactamase superfamily II)
VAGPDLTDDRDAYAYLIGDPSGGVLIDCGAGPSYERLVDNVRQTGRDPGDLTLAVATHAHIDHVGGLAALVRDFGVATAAHQGDAWAIETADRAHTAAGWYGLPLEPTPVSQPLTGDTGTLSLDHGDIVWRHTPGHTPGSIVLWLDRDGRRYLFGQDIHGPFHPDFRSDRDQWAESMRGVLGLDADVLAEGHFGVIDGPEAVRSFIVGYLKQFGYRVD